MNLGSGREVNQKRHLRPKWAHAFEDFYSDPKYDQNLWHLGRLSCECRSTCTILLEYYNWFFFRRKYRYKRSDSYISITTPLTNETGGSPCRHLPWIQFEIGFLQGLFIDHRFFSCVNWIYVRLFVASLWLQSENEDSDDRVQTQHSAFQ